MAKRRSAFRRIMSQKVSRKTAVNEEKDKRQATSPVKEMKKKMAANAEKEKQAAEKATEKAAEKTEKIVEKPDKGAPKSVEKAPEKSDKQDKSEKPEKSAEKKTEKPAEKKAEKPAEKKAEKPAEKKPEPQAEKSKAEVSAEEKNGKPEKQESKKPEASKQKQNGRDRVHNGVSDVTLGTNGTDDVLNGTVSADSEDDDVMLVIDDHDHDELFPELTYDDTSDVECFEPPTPENAPSRSFTRRSQVKATRTPETPRPASDKQTDREPDDPSHKVLKLKDDAPSTDRKLRSADSPKPDGKKKSQDSPKKQDKEGLEKVEEGKTLEEFGKKEQSQEEKTEVEVVVDVETNEGNNTTMEMDITESSSVLEDAALDDSSYLRGLRSIRGRCSYKLLPHDRTTRSQASAGNTPAARLPSEPSRPTGTVVGRKRKPDAEEEGPGAGREGAGPGAPGKRMRVLERLAEPFRRVAAAAEIVGINTDLPLSAPVVSPATLDPEALKPAEPLPGRALAAPLAAARDDTKRCAVM
ncbi:nucleolar and coiled-body phosphoprotein 1-like isoform X4 [Trichoplusia ni]|uniref:Nucleolar and coiled-body phosphoprotein 1-like isoform X4 n=1 Tax=Trichoplusia ni TaxID=7111 RepID=A0A7E5VL47_TRINI|nr:nucleolar and coiled-body phosphoprotein 1-like isoform X4 [Trichoplusia ni]